MQNVEPCRIDIHAGSVTSLDFFVDGKHIVSGYKDGSIRRWRLSDCREIGPVMKSDGTVNSVAASQDGKWIVSGGVDCRVTIWDATSHQKVGGSTEQYERGVTALDISPDSLRIAAGSEDGSVIVWCLESGGRITGPLRHQESQVSSVRFSPTGDRLASACTGWDCDSIRIWHSRTGDLLACLSADTKPTYSLAWTRDGQKLFAGGPRGSIRCFDIAARSILSILGDQISDSVTSLSISNNDRFLVAGSASGCSLSLWDVNTFQPICPTLFQPSEVLTIAISPDDQHLASGAMDKKISIRSFSDIVPSSYFFHVSMLRCSTTLMD
jgi:WD40 repeat protein